MSASVESVLAARDGSVWLGTRDGLDRWNDGRVILYRKRRSQVLETAREITDAGLPDDFQSSLYQDRRGRIWAFSPGGAAYLERGHFIPEPTMPGGFAHAIAEDGAGDLWISQDQGLFHLLRGGVVEVIPWTKLGRQGVALALVADPSGGLWLGFSRGGVAYFKDGQVRAWYAADSGPGGGRVSGLRFGTRGTLWAATEGGLSRINNGKIATLTSKDGLPCDAAHWSMEDNDHAVWLYMACGLVRIARTELDAWVTDPRHTVQTMVFDNSDGVRLVALTGALSPRVGKSTDGKIWFVSGDGVSVLDPRHLPFNKIPPPVYIEQITANGETYDASNGLRLPPRVRDLSIDYTALSFVAPEKVRFRFKLEGQDSDWREVLNNRHVQYSNLAPGDYRFLVTACNNSGVWNEKGVSLDFAIAPAYYQTNWFRALCGAAFLALLWAAYRLRIRQVQQQERKFREAVETIPAMAFTALRDGSRTFVNRRWVEYTGLTAERAAGLGWQAVIHPDDLKRVLEKWRTSVSTGEPMEYEARGRGADGEYRWFLVRAVPLRAKGGSILQWYGVMINIEDRKRAEQEREALRADLAHVNRVSMMGELTASLAHEIKQPIAATVTNANTCLHWLKRDPPDLDEIREAAGRIVEDGLRAGDIIDRLRSLYKNSPPERELVDANQTVREMVVLLRSEANRYSVSTRTDLSADLPKITADRVQLQQVLMNLMLNAIEAMKETGGVLTVSSQLDQDGRVLISVSDTGVGLPAKKADEIFNAFFTTKPQGSGMGLAISRSIVESHGGRLWATPNSGRGATFHFTLPTASAKEFKVPALGT